jgi:hypothetical protein
MHQSHRHESDVTIAPQEPSALVSEPGELTDAELTLVVGGTDGPPTGPGDGTSRCGV